MEKINHDMPVLVAQTGPLNGQRWAVRTVLTIGRDPTCDIVINDRQVSRYHLRLTPSPNGILLEDLASKNGTYYNARLLEAPLYLQDGDLLGVALTQQFVYLSSDATVPLGELGFQKVAIENRGRLFLDSLSRRVWIRNQEVLPPLSVPQFKLLKGLYDQNGQVVSRTEMINMVWGEDESAGVSEQALDALVRRLRDRLALLDPEQAYLVTVRGYGLRLDNPSLEE